DGGVHLRKALSCAAPGRADRRHPGSALSRPLGDGAHGVICASGVTVIASQRVRAKRGPMTGSAKQSRVSYAALDCFVAELLAMTVAIGCAVRLAGTTQGRFC